MGAALMYDPCFNCDRKMCSMCELTYRRNKQIVDEEVKPSYCKYCFNSRVYKPTDEERMDPSHTPLTDDNDYSIGDEITFTIIIPSAHCVETPIVEDSGAIVVTGKSFVVLCLLAKFLAVIYHHRSCVNH